MVNLRRNSAKLINMSRIADNLEGIKKNLGPGCRLIVVSKFRTPEEILAAYTAGQRLFAENRVQALLERRDLLPPDIEWHLIGHLQTNKVKYIAPFISMIHSVDSFKLLSEIDKQAEKCGRVIDCLLQIYVASEETKFGLTEAELIDLLENPELDALHHIRICGIMAMASLTEDEEQIAGEFSEAQRIFDRIKTQYFKDKPWFCELSTGMSSDYHIALNYGSTMVRIGSAVFA